MLVMTPSLLVESEVVQQNIDNMVEMVSGNVDRLRPHIKTNKCREVLQMLLEAGITRVKCATLAEVELAGLSGVPEILLSKQPSLGEIEWLVSFSRFNPHLNFGFTVDDLEYFKSIESLLRELSATEMGVFIDLNVGMGRTGIPVGDEAIELAQYLGSSDLVKKVGIQVYDGHIKEPEPSLRVSQFNAWAEEFKTWLNRQELEAVELSEIVAGGSPTFPVVAKETEWVCSPGTTVFWDRGYGAKYRDMPFVEAVSLATRVISRQGEEIYCLDLGHKAVASENPLEKRVYFPDFPDAEFIQQSEEHLVVRLPSESSGLKIGDIIYGIPWHICPSVALYDRMVVVDGNGNVTGNWMIPARSRIHLLQ